MQEGGDAMGGPARGRASGGNRLAAYCFEFSLFKNRGLGERGDQVSLDRVRRMRGWERLIRHCGGGGRGIDNGELDLGEYGGVQDEGLDGTAWSLASR